MSFSTEDPLAGPVPPTVFLQNTPLTNVLVQVRFPEILSIAKAEFVADFQERIRHDYLLHYLEQHPVLEPGGNAARLNPIPHWRFLDSKRQWRLSLATSFIALETRAYQGRSDFTRRAEAVMRALSETIEPRMTTRVGVRYVNRVHGAHYDQLPRFVRPEMLGLHTRLSREKIERSLHEAVGKTDAGTMVSRWGLMPANQTHEPGLMPPVSSPSWFLDIDVHNGFEPPEDFDAGEISARVKKLATRAYGFFRWTVNDDFLEARGGKNISGAAITGTPAKSPTPFEYPVESGNLDARQACRPVSRTSSIGDSTWVPVSLPSRPETPGRIPTSTPTTSRSGLTDSDTEPPRAEERAKERAEARAASVNIEDASENLFEIRRLTGFTWSLLAGLLNVNRRTLNNWAGGANIRGKNRAHLAKTLGVLRFADRGLAELNATALHEQGPRQRHSPFEAIQAEDYELAKQLLSHGPSRPDKRPAASSMLRIGEFRPILMHPDADGTEKIEELPNMPKPKSRRKPIRRD